jgi:hypothetical protein
MSFGILFDFTGNSNVSRVTNTTTLVKQQWFLDAINDPRPIDMFVVIGHNAIRGTSGIGTLQTVFKTIRELRPETPIQSFGGHTHIRDFAVYDKKSTALESGRYCETLGWLSVTNIESHSYRGNNLPHGVPHPKTPAVNVSGTTTEMTTRSTTDHDNEHGHHGHDKKDPLYARRYLDWNRRTFSYHADNNTLELHRGVRVSKAITADRASLNLTNLYGCAPATYCQFCQPQGSPGNIFTLLETALATVVVNETRKDIPRIIVINTGSVRFDLVEGPFTYDDSFIVSPFADAFQYIPKVPYAQAKQVLGILNAGPYQKRSLDSMDPHAAELKTQDFGFAPLIAQESCVDPLITTDHITGRSYSGSKVTRRSQVTSPGYITSDDFGNDGDDTAHSAIPDYYVTNDIQANGSFPADGSDPETVDMIFLDFIASYIIDALNTVGGQYTTADVAYYLPPSFTTNSYLPAYAKIAWQENVPNCPVGKGVGF